MTADWITRYNGVQPHEALGNIPPRQAKSAENLHKSATLACLSPQTAAAIARGDELTMNESFRFDAMRLANGKLTPYLARMRWEIIEAPTTTAFVTTDSPVFLSILLSS